jgi:hypothetical protein
MAPALAAPGHLHGDPVNDADRGIVASPPVGNLACGSRLMRMTALVNVTTAPRLVGRVGEKPRAPDRRASLCPLPSGRQPGSFGHAQAPSDRWA